MADRWRTVLQEKTVTASFAASLVKDGDLIAYSDHALAPMSFDSAFAEYAGQRKDVAVKTCNMCAVPAFVKQGVGREKVAWVDRHFNGFSRKAGREGLVNYVVGDYGHMPMAYERYQDFDICVIETTPMDEYGYFNFGLSNSETGAALRKAKTIIVETNASVPRALGGYGETIHISKVDYVIDGGSRPLVTLGTGVVDEAQNRIADLVAAQVGDGACLQLGIGTMPNAIGEKLAETDIRDLGVHSEMMTDAFMKLYQSGRVTGRCKTIDRGKMVYSFAMGSQELYDFLDRNPACASYPVDYVNDVAVISTNDNVISINNAVEVDLFSQVSAESKGVQQISGTGGQVDFVWGSYLSKGGKSFICLTSTVKQKDGQLRSRIVPSFDPGTIVTTPRALVNFIVTEYGMVQLKGLSTWTRAERLIEIAHPDFREELIRQAERLHIWRYTNKRI